MSTVFGKKHFVFGLWLLVGLFLVRPARAEHIIGGLFTYTCIGFLNNDPNTGIKVYRMTLRVYRDCQGGGSDFDSTGEPAPTATVTVYQNGSQLLDQIGLRAPLVVSVDPDPGNPCLQVPANVCVEEGVYEFELELPLSSQPYQVVYQRCCRNATISNLLNPAEVGATFAVEITPEAQQLCNAAPDFSQLPPVVACVNNAFTFDLSADDRESDSLVYRLCSPWNGGGPNSTPITAPGGLAPDPDLPPPYNFVPYQQGFSETQPLGPGSQLSLDPQTGILTGLTGQQGQYVIGICVEEYRNGQLLSSIRRDFQINTSLCDDAIVADIESDGRGPNGEFLLRSCGLTGLRINNLSQDEAFISGYRWEIDLGGTILVDTNRNLQIDFPAVGQYPGRLILNPDVVANCRDTAELLIDVSPEVAADFSPDLDSCIYGPVSFPTLVNAPAGGETLSWDFGDGQTTSGADPTHTYARAGRYEVVLAVSDVNGCTDTARRTLAYFPVPANIGLQAQQGCAPLAFPLPPVPAFLTDDYDLSWNMGDGVVLDTWPPGYRYLIPGVFDINLQLVSPTGCLLDTLYPGFAEVLESPEAGFSWQPEVPDFLDPTLDFVDESSRAQAWNWDFAGLGSSTLANPAFTFPDTGRYQVTQIVEAGSGCRDTISRLILIQARNTFFMPNAFTPNEDGLNDIFIGQGIVAGMQEFEFSVWNRFGEPVFESADPAIGWNGRRKNEGNPQPQGVYAWLVKYRDVNGQKVVLKGHVMLLR